MVVALLVLKQSGKICPFSVSSVVTPGELKLHSKAAYWHVNFYLTPSLSLMLHV